MANQTVEYFGMDTVERAIAYYFMKNGVTVKNYEELTKMEIEDGDAFFEMVSNFVENEQG